MSRPIYLIVYHSRPFPAHWAIWIPHKNEPSPEGMGKVIQVEGNPSEGFSHEFKRNYDSSQDSRLHSVILLGTIDGSNILDSDTHANGKGTTDVTAIDEVEKVALSVPAPRPSLRRRFGPEPKSRIELQNCQTWLRDFVAVLIEKGMLTAEAWNAVDGAPKN